MHTLFLALTPLPFLPTLGLNKPLRICTPIDVSFKKTQFKNHFYHRRSIWSQRLFARFMDQEAALHGHRSCHHDSHSRPLGGLPSINKLHRPQQINWGKHKICERRMGESCSSMGLTHSLRVINNEPSWNMKIHLRNDIILSIGFLKVIFQMRKRSLASYHWALKLFSPLFPSSHPLNQWV